MNLIGLYMLAICQYILSLSIISLITHIIVSYYIIQVFRFILFLIITLIKQLIPLNDILSKYGKDSWVVITGATDGIGLGFAEELVKLGFNVCLISRNMEKLQKVKQILDSIRPQKFKHKHVMILQFQFKNCANQKLFTQMVDNIKQLDISVLINNVGTSLIKPYTSFSYQQIKDIININCTSMAVMTKFFLPHLKSRSSSAIINLSSFAGSYPIPYISLYSASKAMNTFFTEGISMEYPNIDVLSVRPMFVESPLSKAKKGFNVPDRRQCAHDCLKQLRWTYETNAYFMHRIFAEAHRLFVPEWARRIIVTYFSEKRINNYNQRKS